MENQSTYRIRTKLGETEPINIPVNLMQEYNSFEILSLKINTDDTYRSYTSTEGIVVGRVSTANNGLGIPNVRVSIFVPKGAYEQSDEEAVIYPFSSPTDMDGDRVRYNLLPSESDVDCYQVIGTLPTKRKILDNETVCEVFEKYYKYTTVTNEAGDFMLTNIPVGKHRIHIDADLSDIGPFLSQKPYNMIENLGFEKNRFESTRQFKTSNDLDSLAQVISQNKSVHVYPYWGDATENGAEIKITRTDLTLNYEFKTQAIFIGSVITDKQSNSIRQNCTATENAGKMSDMVTGPGQIEMIRKTVDNKIEQFKVKGDALINDNGVWCYAVPMNLDYVRTDEFGNIIPTDDPNKGVPTRARVRFRITLNQMESDNDAHKRCSYLVPNNPKFDDEKFLKENDADYSFGSDTWDESFVDLLWNKVYTVKNYVPRIQKTVRPTNRKHTGIKMINHFGDNNPFPYNSMSIKLPFLYRLICVIVHIFIYLVYFLNVIISIIGTPFCKIASIKILGVRPFKFFLNFIPPCIELSSEFCDDGINKNVTFPGCSGCVWGDKTKPDCDKEQYEISKKGGEAAVCTNNDSELFNCVENQLAQQNEATSFNFGNDWINGCLYMPLWYRKIKPKKSFFFGLFKRRAKDQWCAGEKNESGRQLKMASFCSHKNSKIIESKDFKGKKIDFNITSFKDNCGNGCHEVINWVGLTNGVIINRENMFGQKLWYYKAVEVGSPREVGLADEYVNYEGKPMVSKTLFATDIVLLGSLNDCDINGIPKFFNYLKGSTYNMPTDVLFTDTEIEYAFDELGNVLEQQSHKISVSSGCDWGNNNEYGYNDGGLFYSIGCSSIKVDTEACHNLRRICELGVGQDEMQYIENLKVNINNESDELEYNELEYYLRPDGYISYDDINDFDYRSMFATMNGNRLKTKLNSESGVKEYDFRYLYIDNFDGSMKELMSNELKKRTKANYRFNDKLEEANTDYLTFRMSDRPYFYDGVSKVEPYHNEDDKNVGPKKYTLPKYHNSFYFYFGLKEGKTAIDLFNEQYNGPCATKTSEEETIPNERRANGWCVSDSDFNNSYKHENFDGFLKLDFENIPLPCSAILNSRSNAGITYTITNGDGDDTSITDEKICFYGTKEWTKDGDLTTEGQREFNGYKKYYLKYENTIDKNFPEEGFVNGCEMLSNGEYNLYITDGEGNYHSFIIYLNGEYLNFSNVERKFGQPNNVLLKYYKPAEFIQYNNVALSPDDNLTTITVKTDETGVPVVERLDGLMNMVVNENVIEGKYIKLNGTICLYNVMFNDEKLDNFLVEVEPYDVGKDESGKYYYVDKDFWWNPGDETTKYVTWYKKKMANIHSEGKLCKNCSVLYDTSLNREVITLEGDTNYFYYQEVTASDDNPFKIRCYVIKCPKGDVNYRVRVTQLCKDETTGKWYKTKNYIERKINVGQPTPYKLLINDADYDIIKEFKTGWDVRKEEDGDQTKEHCGLNDDEPFKSGAPYDFNAIKGWLEISNINKNYTWGEDEEKYGKTEDTFEVFTQEDSEKGKCLEDEIGEYKLKVALRIKEEKEPKEPQRYQYNDESKYNEEYEKWLNDHEQWENGEWQENGGNVTRKNGYDDVNYVDREHDFGGICGYIYVKKAAQILLNRLDFVTKMKSSFWVQCENAEKTISYSVRTDDNPYDVWTMYNAEMVSQIDDAYNETESKPREEMKEEEKERHSWIYRGESTRYITNIKIPTITAFNNKDFGISEDNLRIKKHPNSYDKIGGKCFGQDNIAGRGEEGSISIKPPYLVACVNAEGITKPNNLKRKEFYGTETNQYGLIQNRFGDVKENDKKWLNDEKGHQFFGFHLIDKIFAPDIVTWAYMDNIPYYLPWWDYDCEPCDCNRLGYTIKTEGILSGFIKNGITEEKGYVTDFDTRNIFDKEVVIKTYEEGDGHSEDDIPTKRCILYGDINEGEKLTYVNYRQIESPIITDENQYRPVPNRQGELQFLDLDGNCETTRTLYGSMKVVLKSSTLNDYKFTKAEQPIWERLFSTSNGENNDTLLTLKVGCLNSDTENPIKYYIFEASQQKEVGSAFGHKKCWYPLNAFVVETKDKDGNLNNPFKYTLDCKCDSGTTHEDWVWDGSTEKAPYFFNKNTEEKIFKDKYGVEDDLVKDEGDFKPKSNIQWENSNGEVKLTPTVGYGNTGVFEGLEHKPYFVVAVTENNCRAVSPVYDFHIVYYVAGLTQEGGQKLLRTALVYVLKDKGKCGTSDEGYNESKLGGEYCKKPRNYYLTQFDFTIDYTFANGSTLISNNGVLYEKSDNKFVSKEEYEKDDAPIGSSYVEDNGDGTFTIHTKTGGTPETGEAKEERPSEGSAITKGDYYYKEKGSLYYQVVTITEKGDVIMGERTLIKPITSTEISVDENYYVQYSVTDPETGETKNYYVSVAIVSQTSHTVNYDPRVPYFMRYNDKYLTDEEYDSLERLFETTSNVEKAGQFYVTDVTGLKHKCKLHRIIKNKDDWKKLLKYPEGGDGCDCEE